MLVEKMIEELKKHDPKATVRLHGKDGEPALFVVTHIDDLKNVWIESESDANLAEEIPARFAAALENQVEELDFYMELLDMGIDADIVKRYMGDECAAHMLDFCTEHGRI